MDIHAMSDEAMRRTEAESSRYRSLNDYFREQFGGKVYKLALDAGMTCPNRDGRLGVGGCSFCADGSSTFAAKQVRDVEAQLDSAKALLARKTKADKPLYMAYFQSYTNTYAPVEILDALFRPVLEQPDIVGLAIGTRPDCLPDDVIALLHRLNQVKPVWVELGLQTIHERTALAINRCHTLDTFEQALAKLHEAGIETVVHLIFGLPGESREDMLATVDYVASLPIQGVKLHLLHVLEGTALAEDYRAGKFSCLREGEWLDLLCEILPRLPSGMVIHRLTGDGPKELLLAPLWTADKRRVLNRIQATFRERNIRQGSAWTENSWQNRELENGCCR